MSVRAALDPEFLVNLIHHFTQGHALVHRPEPRAVLVHDQVPLVVLDQRPIAPCEPDGREIHLALYSVFVDQKEGGDGHRGDGVPSDVRHWEA